MTGKVDQEHNRTTSNESGVTLTPVEARQGLLGRPVLMVLLGGLALALVAWAMSEMFGEAIDSGSSGDIQQSSPAPTAAPENQPSVDNSPPAGERMESAPTDRDPTSESGTGGASQSTDPVGTEK